MNFQYLVGKTIVKVDEYPSRDIVTLETSDGERIEVVALGDNYGDGTLVIGRENE